MREASAPTAAPRTRYNPIRGTGAAVVAGHPVAVATGMRILDRGGNAVDAAIATAATVAVVRPHMCGVAGDGFFLIYDASARRVHALNAGGPAPAAVTPDHFRGGMPDRGGILSTVPGILDGWRQAHARFGTLPWAELLQPAIETAERGFPMYESLADWIGKYQDKYRADAACAEVLLPGGRPPEPGTLFRQPDLAGTLRRIAERGAREFYEGELAATFTRGLAPAGGLVTARDLAVYRAMWGEPVRATYRGHVVHTPPPLSQGWMLLQMLSALDGVGLGTLPYERGDRVVLLANAVRAAFEDRDRWFGDPRWTGFALDRVLSPERIAEIRAGLRGRTRSTARAERPGDTTALSAIDAEGNAVSMIQSLWTDAGVMIPGTGILVNGRLNSASARLDHPDVVTGGKTPVYTLHTYMVTRDDRLRLIGGTPGGHSQVQTNLQVVTNILDYGFSPQMAVEAPRFLLGGTLHYDTLSAIFLEGRFPGETRRELESEGYAVTMLADWAEMAVEGASPVTVGSAKVIGIDPETGIRALGVDPRRDAYGAVR
ncbi:MAG TPA: gamma-glutamyltransferase family protein [bacterium]|nr:gamma-glutamyltransferase family protein [bacterium]